MKTIISEIAHNCDWHKTVNDQFIDECERRLNKLESLLPSGSGIDAGCKIDIDKSSSNKVIINFGFHHMDENGYYDGWTEHSIIVTPKLWDDFDIKITGRDRNQIKDYLYDLFDTCFRTIVKDI